MIPLPFLLPFLLTTVHAAVQHPLGAGHAAGHHQACLHSPTVTQINNLLRTGGEGTGVPLCPNAIVQIDPHDHPITFTAPHQSIYTSGVPEDHTRATIVITDERGRVSGELTTAIKANCANCRNVIIRNVLVDGGRAELGGIEGGDALILVGGDSGEQEVRNVEAWGARGFAVLHGAEGPRGTCASVQVHSNYFHSSGDAPLDLMLNSELVRLREGPAPHLGQERPGHWTDGISMACAASSIMDNTIHSVSGVGIALRGAHGSQVLSNTIVAKDRDMLVGISVVNHPVIEILGLDKGMGGVVIRDNSIHAASAMIRIGISTGASAWAPEDTPGAHDIAFGSEVVKNRLSSYIGYFGYAIAISDAKGIVVQDNAVSASIWGFKTPSCPLPPSPTFPLPAPLLRSRGSVLGQLQKEFRELHYGFLLCVGPGSISSSNDISQHQINEEYIESVAVRKRKAVQRHHHVGVTVPKGEVGEGARKRVMGRRERERAEHEKEASRGREKWYGADEYGYVKGGGKAKVEEKTVMIQGIKRKVLSAPRQLGSRIRR
ncbi:Pectin lyase fold/virulence factor superfamily protein [Pseudohyphozyma bogoriensis]|nr:Pectin lyase fold/virulence factor superfamily protein [Pseudohyphozyma bogoriensis]